MTSYTVPGLDRKDNDAVVDLLQRRLASYNDLHLTLKHVHWNVVGRSFIGVHEMLDPQVELVRGYADEVAERIATMGRSRTAAPATSSRPAIGRTTRWAATPSRRT